MQLDTLQFGNELKKLGFNFYSGIPCSFLNNLINYAINECNYIMSTNEGDAVATCCGAYLAGKKSVVLMQNSGLSNAVSPITSLNYPFQIPILGFVSLRGELGINDEPQHQLMGTITEKMLSLMDVEWEYLSTDIKQSKEQLLRANKLIESKNKSFFFVVKKNTFTKIELNRNEIKKVVNKIQTISTKPKQLPKRIDVLKRISKNKGQDTILLATTGKTGRELYEIDDAPNNLYMVGSMGCISSLALGLSLNTSKKVIAIDGDGALMMRMGNLATNAYYAPKTLLHILIDNNMHDSTGGQFTVSKNVDFVQIAASVGYEESIYINSLDEVDSAIIKWKKEPRLTFIYINIKQGTKENLARPTIKPYEVKERLMDFLLG